MKGRENKNLTNLSSCNRFRSSNSFSSFSSSSILRRCFNVGLKWFKHLILLHLYH